MLGRLIEHVSGTPTALEAAITVYLITEMEVRFVPEGAGHTRVELEHRNLERHSCRIRAYVLLLARCPSDEWQRQVEEEAAE